MFLRPLKRVIAALFVPALLTLTCLAQPATGDTQEGVKIEFPAGGQLRIENEFGSIAAESWEPKYVSVTTNQQGARSKLSSS